ATLAAAQWGLDVRHEIPRTLAGIPDETAVCGEGQAHGVLRGFIRQSGFGAQLRAGDRGAGSCRAWPAAGCGARYPRAVVIAPIARGYAARFRSRRRRLAARLPPTSRTRSRSPVPGRRRRASRPDALPNVVRA